MPIKKCEVGMMKQKRGLFHMHVALRILSLVYVYLIRGNGDEKHSCADFHLNNEIWTFYRPRQCYINYASEGFQIVCLCLCFGHFKCYSIVFFSVACSTVTVTKCQAALRTLQAFPFFKPTCLCREPHVDPECSSFRDFLFDHPCLFVTKKGRMQSKLFLSV